MEKTAFLCSGHRWTPAAGPAFLPGPRACACGVAPTSSCTPRGPPGKWCLCPAQHLLQLQPGVKEEIKQLVALTVMAKPCS